MLEVISQTGDPKNAEVFIAKVRGSSEKLIEFVDAVDPRYPRDEKWVAVVSTQIGCPVGCIMCDSGFEFLGNLTKDEIFAQIDHVVERNHFRDHPKFKVQFARMGEPALNDAVLDALSELPSRYGIKGILPCIATTAPAGRDDWFARLAEIKDELYPNGLFQLQFSANSTSEDERNRQIPIKKWSLEQISAYSDRFFRKGDRKVCLNFALIKDTPFEPDVIADIFNPQKTIIKLTPINPTKNALDNKAVSQLTSSCETVLQDRLAELEAAGFEVIISIGAAVENEIGSNCGQSVRRLKERL